MVGGGVRGKRGSKGTEVSYGQHQPCAVKVDVRYSRHAQERKIWGEMANGGKKAKEGQNRN